MAKPSILIAESDEDLCGILKSSLTDHGYEVIESPDKTSTLRFVQTRTPDLVIVGYRHDQAPDGLELTHQIRKLDRRLPIILITPTHTDELILAALRAGVKDYLKHPFPVGELLGSVQRCLNNYLSRKASKPELVPSSDVNGNWIVGGAEASRKSGHSSKKCHRPTVTCSSPERRGLARSWWLSLST